MPGLAEYCPFDFQGSDRIEARDTRQLCMADTADIAGMRIVELGERSAHSGMLKHRSCAADSVTLSIAHRRMRFVQPAQHSSKRLGRQQQLTPHRYTDRLLRNKKVIPATCRRNRHCLSAPAYWLLSVEERCNLVLQVWLDRKGMQRTVYGRSQHMRRRGARLHSADGDEHGVDRQRPAPQVVVRAPRLLVLDPEPVPVLPHLRQVIPSGCTERSWAPPFCDCRTQPLVQCEAGYMRTDICRDRPLKDADVHISCRDVSRD